MTRDVALCQGAGAAAGRLGDRNLTRTCREVEAGDTRPAPAI